MYELNQCLRFFVEHKIHSDPAWKELKVVLSGSDVPGEGEHKILEFMK
jgi:5'-3' exonuclease